MGQGKRIEHMDEPIAIIGIGCRFPGGVSNPQDFWHFLLAGEDGIVDVPADRWNMDRFYSADANAPGKMYIRKGGFLRQPVDQFDPLFFGISPREAGYNDPQQRLLLEVSWEALEDGGLAPTQLAGTTTGVYIGGFALDSLVIQLSPLNRGSIRTHHVATAASMTMLAARLSYVLDLRGPCIALDTACSSSLVALHYACQDIWSGECSLALAGGVNVMICPQFPMVMCKGHFLAPDGHCKSFDERADGYARGEGCGIVVLKPLATALHDGDRIYAVICGTGINHDGHTDGVSFPNREAQEALIRRVYARANVPFDRVRYVEAHGTGTAVGDPIEASVLGRTIGDKRNEGDACLLGSVKANIGHLEAAAGIAGVIKTALCLKHRQVPPQVLQNPNPDIPFEDWGLKLPRSIEHLADEPQPAYAGVNSFGYGGTNAHAILAQAPARKITKRNRSQTLCGARVLPISARNEAALRELTSLYATSLAHACPEDLDDICWSASTRRAHFEYRLAAVADTPEMLSKELTSYLASGPSSNVATGHSPSRQPRLVFAFSGMGPQWWAMGQELLQREPVFRQAVERCDSLFEQIASWSILAEMRKPESQSRMRETQIAQPANFVLQVALVELLTSWGIRPAAVVGHSVGEVAAAYVSGILELHEAVRVIFHRSRLQQTTAGTGKMLAVGQSASAVPMLIAGHEHEVSVAAINSPSSVVLSGDEGALEAIAATLAEQNVFHRMLQVEVPYHSPVMERLQGGMLDALNELHPNAPTVPTYSTVTGNVVADGEGHKAEYWYRNMRQPVLFGAAIERLLDDGHTVFLEIGPHPVITPSIRECLSDRAGEVVCCLRRGEPEGVQMARALAWLYTIGCSVEWSRVYPGSFNFVPLPTYPWQREVHWLESSASLADRRAKPEHPLLRERMSTTSPVWESEVDTSYASYLADHVIEDAVVFPAAAYIEAWLGMQKMIEGRETAVLEDLAFEQMVVVDPAQQAKLQWSYDSRTRELRTYSRTAEGEVEWNQVARARLANSEAWTEEHRNPASLKGEFSDRVDPEEFYAKLRSCGLRYGPSFQCIRALWRRPNEVLARLEMKPPEGELDGYRVHPTVLDACFQVLAAAVTAPNGREMEGLFVPVAIRQIRYHAKTGTHAWCVGTLLHRSQSIIDGNIVLFDENGKIAMEIVGLQFASLGRESKHGSELQNWTYASRWEKAVPPVSFADSGRWVIFVEDGQIGSSVADHLRSQGAAEVVEVAAGSAYARTSSSRFDIRRREKSDLERISKDADIASARGVVYLWPLDNSGDPSDPAGIVGVLDALLVIQALIGAQAKPPRLYVITRSARQVLPGEALQGLSRAPLIGLAQVVANEFPDLRCTSIDLGAVEDGSIACALGAELLADSAETDVALRGSERFVHRLVRLAAPDRPVTVHSATTNGPDNGFRLQSGMPGGIDGLQFHQVARRAPGRGEIEVQVRTAGLNFKDVIKALGILPKKATENTFHASGLGMEAAAVVTRVGDGVTNYAPGDALIASLPNSFSSHVTVAVDTLLAIRDDQGLKPEQSASIPVAFMTAYYALHELAKLAAGETVLIHAATGGVGLAAVQVAQWAGAEIFATAGNQAKRDYLRGLGIKHVWDSRNLAFAQGIEQATGGRGVDVVLNSIPGDGVLKSLSVMAPMGRFVEIGKRDIVENNPLPMLYLNGNVSLFTVDLDRMMIERPDLVRRLLNEVLALFHDGSFKPLPVTVFPAAVIADAFRLMAQSKQIGKVVIDIENTEGLNLIASHSKEKVLRSDATYLITGGFGGVGLELCKAVAARGARHLAIVGRRGPASPAAKQVAQELRDRGVSIAELVADVSKEDEVREVLAHIATSMPPLRGIFHAAGVVEDAYLPDLSAEAVAKVMGPKALGAWHLHEQSRALPIELFVLFSSATALIGNPGQANYVAANAFLDALAHHRRAVGLPALSVNWGALGGGGMVASNSRVAEFLRRSGVREIPAAAAMQALFRLLELEEPQVGVIDMDWRRWGEINPAAAGCPQFSTLLSTPPDEALGTGDQTRLELQRMEAKHRLAWLSGALAGFVAAALHLPPEKIDVYQPFSQLGIDSLLAAELQATVSAKLGIQISAPQFIKAGTIVGLAQQLLEKIAVSYIDAAADRTVEHAPPAPATPPRPQVAAE